ncbi:MAG: hypothetical protein ABEK04_01880, partial [Candidatus Nanohalobium sp.]
MVKEKWGNWDLNPDPRISPNPPIKGAYPFVFNHQEEASERAVLSQHPRNWLRSILRRLLSNLLI